MILDFGFDERKLLISLKLVSMPPCCGRGRVVLRMPQIILHSKWRKKKKNIGNPSLCGQETHLPAPLPTSTGVIYLKRNLALTHLCLWKSCCLQSQPAFTSTASFLAGPSPVHNFTCLPFWVPFLYLQNFNKILNCWPSIFVRPVADWSIFKQTWRQISDQMVRRSTFQVREIGFSSWLWFWLLNPAFC